MPRPLCRLTRLAPLAAFLAASAAAQAPAAQAPAAQAPAPQPAAPAIPRTPAGEALRAWLDAFNSADTARLAAYVHEFEPRATVGDLLAFRGRTGGFDLLVIGRSEPRHLEYTVRERRRPMTAYGALDVSATEPRRVLANRLQAAGPDVSAAALAIDAATRTRVVAGAAAQLDTFYVFPDVAKRMGDSLRARLARGAYEGYANGIAFAMRLDDDLAALAHDKHLRVTYSARPLPPTPPAPSQRPAPAGAPPPRPAEDVARERQFMDEVNCGFVRAEQLPGNVGYVKFNMFADPDACGPTAAAALTFVAGARALILDLRENGGGSPDMVAYVASYLFDRRTHLNDLWTRATGKTEEFWTRDSVPGRRFGGARPVVVLTSARTFSGGEEFTYDLKSLRRATVVGETTGGGAHPVRGRRIDEHFTIGVPFARAVNPVTKTNWEGVGVEPDVKVPAGDALAKAQQLVIGEPGDAPRDRAHP